MANPLYKQMQNRQQGDIGQSFAQFMSQRQGQNPREIINQMVRSGQISQQQLNAVQQRAQQMSGMFDQFKSRFGF